jgi:hypothetical protein
MIGAKIQVSFDFIYFFLRISQPQTWQKFVKNPKIFNILSAIC